MEERRRRPLPQVLQLHQQFTSVVTPSRVDRALGQVADGGVRLELVEGAIGPVEDPPEVVERVTVTPGAQRGQAGSELENGQQVTELDREDDGFGLAGEGLCDILIAAEAGQLRLSDRGPGGPDRKLVAICGALAAIVLLPIAAEATTSQTIHMNGVPIDVGPAGCVPGDLIISGNGVLHMTVNNAGDSWITGTVEGPATVTGSTGATLFSGHAAAWFGSENNAQNNVQHFIANADGTLANGTPVHIHQEGQFTVNAQGIPTVTRVTVTCG